MRPILPEERRRFDETLEEQHWLGAGLVGETMRYVGLVEGEWAALVGFGSAALCVRSREELLGWNDSQRHRRLRYITNNQRFCVLEERRRHNLASEVLGIVLRRLAGDFQARWGHQVVAVETFTDPARHLGTCYKASNFALIGYTSGYGRRAGRFVHHGGQKAYWLRPLRRDATRLLAMDFDHPVVSARYTMNFPDLNRLDFSGLLETFEALPDPRKARGIRHRLAQVLGVAALGSVCGAKSLFAIGEIAAELPEEALERLGCFYSPSLCQRVPPEESTIRRVLQAIDADEFDRLTNAWIADQVATGRLAEAKAPQVKLSVVLEEDAQERYDEEPDRDNDDGHDDRDQDQMPPGAPADGEPVLLPAVAVDGKTLRGARLDDDRKVHLLSALDIREKVTLAQADVDGKTNEITVFRPMLGHLDLKGVVVTADPLHAQVEHARFLVEEKGAHYVLGVKANMPSLLAAAAQAFVGVGDHYVTDDKGHGRIEHRYYSVVTISEELREELGFPYAASFVRVYRERCNLADVPIGKPETSYYVSDLQGELASPEAFAFYIRGHWGIENSSHHVRDMAFDEDRCTVRTGAAPQVLATLRNLAISLLRLAGFDNIASGLRYIARDHTRAMRLLGL